MVNEVLARPRRPDGACLGGRPAAGVGPATRVRRDQGDRTCRRGAPFQEVLDQVTGRRLPTVDALYGSEDNLEGFRAFAEKRPPCGRAADFSLSWPQPISQLTSSRWRAPSPQLGEVVLRRRLNEENAADALELRVNGVFVMDTRNTSYRDRARGRRPGSWWISPTASSSAASGSVSPCSAVLEDVRVEKVRRGRDRGRADRLDARRHGAARTGVPGRRAADRSSNLDIAIAVDEPTPGAYDLVLLDVDNGPGYLVHDANAQDLPARRSWPPYDVHWRRAARSRSGRPTQAPALAGGAARGVRRRRPSWEYDVDLQGRAETYWLYVSNVGT